MHEREEHARARHGRARAPRVAERRQEIAAERDLLDEHQNVQEALVSTLSAGLVGPSDGVGAADATLLARTCRADGLLLKPDKPATPIDAMFLPHTRPYTVSTYSKRDGVGTWTYLAAYALWRGDDVWRLLDGVFAAIEYDEPLDDMFVLPETITNWSVDLTADLGIGAPVVAYDWRSGRAQLASRTVDLAPLGKPFDYDFVVLAPVLENGLALIGEPAKFVTLADKRFRDVRTTTDSIEVTLDGAPGEPVTLLAYDTRSERLLPEAHATLGANGTAEVTLAR